MLKLWCPGPACNISVSYWVSAGISGVSAAAHPSALAETRGDGSGGFPTKAPFYAPGETPKGEPYGTVPAADDVTGRQPMARTPPGGSTVSAADDVTGHLRAGFSACITEG